MSLNIIIYIYMIYTWKVWKKEAFSLIFFAWSPPFFLVACSLLGYPKYRREPKKTDGSEHNISPTHVLWIGDATTQPTLNWVPTAMSRTTVLGVTLGLLIYAAYVTLIERNGLFPSGEAHLHADLRVAQKTNVSRISISYISNLQGIWKERLFRVTFLSRTYPLSINEPTLSPRLSSINLDVLSCSLV